jgi:hypothetical protein
MQVDGSGAYPFVLREVDAGSIAIGEHIAALLVGARTGAGDVTSGYVYEGEGNLIAGDLQLPGNGAPVTAAYSATLS